MNFRPRQRRYLHAANKLLFVNELYSFVPAMCEPVFAINLDCDVSLTSIAREKKQEFFPNKLFTH